MKGRIAPIAFFGLFMVFGGAFLCFFFAPAVFNVARARTWTATPCRIVSSSVASHSGSKGGSTYREQIVFSYEVAGHQYQSDRYQFLGGSSSGYEGKAIIVRQHPAGSAGVCYVNPHNPGEAVFERGFTVEYCFGLIPLVFVFIGAGGMVFSLKRAKTSATALPGDAPWRQRPEWAAGRIPASTKTNMQELWFFAAVWNLISMPLLFILPGEVLQKHNYPALLGLLFPVVGVGLIIAAVRATLRWRKYGDTVFELASVPGVIGGALEGRIALGQLLRPEGGCHVKLSCLRRVVSSGRNSSTSEYVLWQSEQETSGGMTDAILVLFAIPADCQETNDGDPRNRVLWRLEAKAKVPGVDFAAQFEVPVFKVALTPTQAAAAQRAQTQAQAVLAHYQRPVTSPIRVGPAPGGGTEFYFPAGRNPGTATGFTIFLLVWTGAIGLQIHFKAPVLFPIVTGLFDLLFVSIAANLWFRSSQVVVGSATTTITSRCLGFGRDKTTSSSEIVRITKVVGMTAGTTAYQDIKFVLRDGSALTAASYIKDAQEAEWLVAEMAKAAGSTP